MAVGPAPGPNDSYAGQGNASGASAAGTSTPQPIGVPYGLKPNYNPGQFYGPTSPGVANYPYDVVPSRYFSGDEWTELPTYGPDLSYLQQSLIQTGMLDRSGIVLGQPDAKTANAMQQLLAVANSQGSDWRTALELRLKAAAENPPAGNQRAPLVVKLKNADDLKAVLQSGANNIFGKYLAPEDLQKFIDGYHAQEASAQTAAYSASGYNPDTGQQDLSGAVGSGATVTGPPSTDAGIARSFESQMFQDHPTQAGESVFSNKLNLILAGLHSGGGPGQ